MGEVPGTYRPGNRVDSSRAHRRLPVTDRAVRPDEAENNAVTGDLLNHTDNNMMLVIHEDKMTLLRTDTQPI